MQEKKEACHCHNVTYGQIIAAVRAGADSLEAVQQRTGCGTGCGKCKPFLEHFVQELLEEIAAKSGGKIRLDVIDPQPFSEEEDRATGFGLMAASSVQKFSKRIGHSLEYKLTFSR